MRRSSRLMAWGAVLAAAGAGGSPGAMPQPPLLDLRQSEAPGAGTGAGALALADRLQSEAAALRAGEPDPVRGAGAALRRLASRLLADGERAGPVGSARVLLGRTLADRIPTIDAWITDRGSPEDEPALVLLAQDIETALAAPALADPDIFVRDALAGLTLLAHPPRAPAGWVAVSPIVWPGPLVATDDWASAGLITPETAAALREFDASLTMADAWPVYQRSAARVRALLSAAADAARTPAWIEAAARDAIRRRFNEAVRDVCGTDSRSRGVAALEWLAALGAVIARAERLDGSSAPAAAAVKRARAAMGQHLAVQPADPAEARRALATAERVLALAGARGELPPETRLLRQVRPAFRVLLVEARAGEPQVLGVLPEALRRADAMTEPGIVAAVGRQQRVIDDLRLLVALSTAMTDPTSTPDREPVLRTGWDGVASLVLAAGQSLSKPELHDSALSELRTLAERIAGSMPLPGEAAMEAALAGRGAGGEERGVWSELTGGREGELPPDIADRRRVWLSSWGRRQFKESDAEGVRLDNLRLLLGTLRDVAPVHALIRAPGPGAARDRYEALQAWPGWQLSLESLARLADGLPARISAATALALGPEQNEATAQLEAIRSDYAAVRLAGRLMVEAAARGFVGDQDAAAALHELTAGAPVESGPGATWLGDLLGPIADTCRYAEEVGSAESLGARERAQAFRKYVNLRAAEALARLDAVP